MKRSRAYTTHGDTQDAPRGGHKRTLRRQQRASLARELRQERDSY